MRRTFAARFTSRGLTQKIAPYRPPPAETASTAVTLIFAAASFPKKSAQAPMRSFPWTRKPVFLELSFHFAFRATLRKPAGPFGMKSS